MTERLLRTLQATRTVVEHGRVVDLIANVQLAASMDKLHEYLGV